MSRQGTKQGRTRRRGHAVAALIAAALCLVPAVTASAHAPDHGRGEVYFLAPDGDDAATGDRRHPWATLAHAEEMVEPGDTVYLRDGV